MNPQVCPQCGARALRCSMRADVCTECDYSERYPDPPPVCIYHAGDRAAYYAATPAQQDAWNAYATQAAAAFNADPGLDSCPSTSTYPGINRDGVTTKWCPPMYFPEWLAAKHINRPPKPRKRLAVGTLYRQMLAALPRTFAHLAGSPQPEEKPPVTKTQPAAWQPIDTAPRDGRWFAARTASGWTRVVKYAHPHDRFPAEPGNPAAWSTPPVEWLVIHEQPAFSSGAPPAWRPIETAKKDRTVIWAVLRPDIYPVLEPERPDLATWNGLHLPMRHNGLESDGFDIGWQVAAPVGQGGFPDQWIAGWMPVPAPPHMVAAINVDLRHLHQTGELSATVTQQPHPAPPSPADAELEHLRAALTLIKGLYAANVSNGTDYHEGYDEALERCKCIAEAALQPAPVND